MTNFDQALQTFIAGSQVILNDELDRSCPSLDKPTLSGKKGRRYVKVIRADVAQRSVHCFVDTTNGDVLKAAGWSAPAKHARGNIFDDHNGLRFMGPYGAAYLA